jgi:hypothetical protein
MAKEQVLALLGVKEIAQIFTAAVGRTAVLV